MLKLFPMFFFSILPVYSCNQYLEPPVFNSLDIDINMQIYTYTDDSILVSDFHPFNNKINKCKRSIDYEKVGAPGFQKQTLFCDAVSSAYDYLTASTDELLHYILMAVYENFNGKIMKIPIMSYWRFNLL